eukprot:6435943-Amphidinium_carterae.1
MLPVLTSSGVIFMTMSCCLLRWKTGKECSQTQMVNIHWTLPLMRSLGMPENDIVDDISLKIFMK